MRERGKTCFSLSPPLCGGPGGQRRKKGKGKRKWKSPGKYGVSTAKIKNLNSSALFFRLCSPNPRKISNRVGILLFEAGQEASTFSSSSSSSSTAVGCEKFLHLSREEEGEEGETKESSDFKIPTSLTREKEQSWEEEEEKEAMNKHERREREREK